MNEEEFRNMENALRSSMRRFPNCKIANCDCDSKQEERIGDYMCLCHITKNKDGKTILPHQIKNE